MSAKILCPNGHPIAVREEHAGRRLKCPACGAAVVVTAPVIDAPQPPVANAPGSPSEVVEYDPSADRKGAASPRKPKGERKPRGAKHPNFIPAVGIIVGVIGLVLLVGGIVLWIFVLGPYVEHLSFPSESPRTPAAASAIAGRTPLDEFHDEIENYKRRFGEQHTVLVCIKGAPIGERQTQFPILGKLRSLGYGAGTMKVIAGGQAHERDYLWVLLGGVQDVNTLKNQLDFGRVVSVRVGRINMVVDPARMEGRPEK